MDQEQILKSTFEKLDKQRQQQTGGKIHDANLVAMFSALNRSGINEH